MKGREFSEEHRQKLSEAQKKRLEVPFSESKYRQKLSEVLKGNKRWLGKKHTEETRRKISAAGILRHQRKREMAGTIDLFYGNRTQSTKSTQKEA